MHTSIKHHLREIFTIIAVLLCTMALHAQQSRTEHTNEINPAMRVSVKDGMVQLTCRSGCAWTDLSFSLERGQTELVNEYGKVSAKKEAMANPDLSPFLFSAKKNGKGAIIIKNIEGMSFKTIKFNSGKNGAMIVKT